ncbi:hypothetical protein BGZ60DRAFT_437829 [Tricladium varicosporioides]|nr:hypothetical protein BGZ60DRAFT_437829 [Hymenoscyphus varicosporioides]
MENSTETPELNGVAGDPLYDLPGQKATERPEEIPAPILEPEQDLEASEYSDIPSGEDSSTSRRKYQRGGRRQRQRDAPSDSDNFRGEVEVENGVNGRKKRTMNSALPHRGSTPTLGTGIKAFNIRKADQSGGRPFGVSVERPKSKTSSQKKRGSKTKSKKKICTECGRKKKSREEDWEDDSNEEGESSSEEEGEKPKGKKPMSIRLDLNLELEIFLRAKIKGDVTITFL